jgi:uncharacterized membrane protein YdbT with pleckstrin-like domain
MTIMLGVFSFGLDILELTTMFYVLLVLLILIPLIAFLIGSYWANKWWENFSFELENEGVRINAGVITKTQKFIPYKKIQDLTIVSGFWERRYGLSTIQIETAGTAGSYRGRASPEGVIPGLRAPEPIANEIRARMEKNN